MQVGDLIQEKAWPGVFLLVVKVEPAEAYPYAVLDPYGTIEHFSRGYVEDCCEVLSEGR